MPCVIEPIPRELGPGACPHPAEADLHDRVQPRKIHHYATFERHRLTVVAGAAAAHRDRDLVAVAGPQGTDHLGLVARLDHQIGANPLQLALEDRAVPVKITALELNSGGIGDPRDVAEVGLQVAEVVHDSLSPIVLRAAAGHAPTCQKQTQCASRPSARRARVCPSSA
jgi:hypothetical protein